MKSIGNLIWFVVSGLYLGLLWWFAGLIMYITIIGIPWGKSCFTLGTFTFFPFGKEAISRKELTGEDDIGTGALGMAGNIIWFFLSGIWLATAHILFSIPCFLTIIGIPFGIQHIKLARVSLFPIGKAIVTKEAAAEARNNYNIQGAA